METKEKMQLLYCKDNRAAIRAGLSRMKILTQGASTTVIALYGDRDHWVYFATPYTLSVMGDRIFWKRGSTTTVSFKDHKLYGDIQSCAPIICEVFHIDWLTSENSHWVYSLIKSNKTLWKYILTGSITNPEQLCKKFISLYFGKHVYTYKTIKRYFNTPMGSSVSFWDLYYYTTNPELALKRWVDFYARYNNMYNYGKDENHTDFSPSLFMDVLAYCRILNTKLNPLWSRKRFEAEHARQIERVKEEEIAEKDANPVFSPFCNAGLSLIDNEKDCFLEGNYMHNCVHSCYWRKIKQGDYLIARGKVEGEYVDVGITVTPTSVSLQQIHTMYNRNPMDKTVEYCKHWIKDNEAALLERTTEAKSKSVQKVTPFVWGTEIEY